MRGVLLDQLTRAVVYDEPQSFLGPMLGFLLSSNQEFSLWVLSGRLKVHRNHFSSDVDEKMLCLGGEGGGGGRREKSRLIGCFKLALSPTF